MCLPVRRWTRRLLASAKNSIPSVAGVGPSTAASAAIPGYVDLEREVSEVEQDDAVDEQREIRSGDRAAGAGRRDGDLRDARAPLAWRAHREAVQERLETRYRIDLDHRNLGEPAPEVRGHAPAAGAVTENRHSLPVRRTVRNREI